MRIDLNNLKSESEWRYAYYYLRDSYRFLTFLTGMVVLLAAVMGILHSYNAGNYSVPVSITGCGAFLMVYASFMLWRSWYQQFRWQPMPIWADDTQQQ